MQTLPNPRNHVTDETLPSATHLTSSSAVDAKSIPGFSVSVYNSRLRTNPNFCTTEPPTGHGSIPFNKLKGVPASG